MGRLISYILIVLVGSVLSTHPVPAQQKPMDGNEVVRRMAVAYESAKSYQDEGIVQSSRSSKPESYELINSFKTYFVRPAQLRFQWNEAEPGRRTQAYIIWSDGKTVQSYSHLMGLEKEKSLSSAVAGATGISRGAAHTVSTLLLREVSGFRLTEMERLTLLRKEYFEGVDCFVVRGYHPFGFPIDIWIGKSDFLLRRMREQNDDGTVDEEIRRNVKLGEPIAEDVFQFTPPSTAERLVGCLSTFLLPIAIGISFVTKRTRSA
jgi:outer membrane lipoprotein-sorting protein